MIEHLKALIPETIWPIFWGPPNVKLTDVPVQSPFLKLRIKIQKKRDI